MAKTQEGLGEHEAHELVDSRYPILTPDELQIRKGATYGDEILDGEGRFVRLPDIEGRIFRVPIGLVTPNPDQVRKFFDPARLEELKASIQAGGQLEAIKLDPWQRGKNRTVEFFTIDGERRWRALKDLGSGYVLGIPKWVPTLEDVKLESAIYNLSHAENNPLEKGLFFKDRMDAVMAEAKAEGRGISRTEAMRKVAGQVGLSYQSVANYLQLLDLPKTIQQMILQNELPTYGVLQMAQASRRFGDKLDLVKAARLLVDNPDKKFTKGEGVKGSQGVKYTRRAIRDALQQSLVGGDRLSAKDRKSIEAGSRVIEFVSMLGQAIKRCGGLLDPEYQGAIISVMNQRKGYPPELIGEKMGELSRLLRDVHEKVVRVASAPPPLEIPQGKPRFSEQVGRRKSVFGNEMRFGIARQLARASDEGGKVLFAQDMIKELKGGDGVEITPTDITAFAGHMKFLSAELAECDLRLETWIARRRSKATGELDKVPAYRVAWSSTKLAQQPIS